MWWLTDQARLRAEREAIEALSAEWFHNPSWSVDDQLRLTLAFDIVGRARPLFSPTDLSQHFSVIAA